jgi:hypothetical protein
MQPRLRMVMSAVGAGLVALTTMAGCVSQQPDTTTQTTMPAPTVAAMFEPPRATPMPPPQAIPTSILAARSAATGDQQPPRGMEDLIEIPIYTDQLSPGWTVQPSSNIVCNTQQQGFMYQGQRSIMCMPSGDDGKLFFVLDSTARAVFQRERVVAVSFYLSGGNIPIETSRPCQSPSSSNCFYLEGDKVPFEPMGMSVSMQGSNAYAYWVANDTSVQLKGRDLTQGGPLFAETGLPFLGLRGTIQVNEWAQAILWLDNQIYDPEYKYVVGFYIITDQIDVPRFYVDQVSLLVSK